MYECDDNIIRDMIQVNSFGDNDKCVILVNPRFNRYFDLFCQYSRDLGTSLLSKIYYTGPKEAYLHVFDPFEEYAVIVSKPLRGNINDPLRLLKWKRCNILVADE